MLQIVQKLYDDEGRSNSRSRNVDGENKNKRATISSQRRISTSNIKEQSRMGTPQKEISIPSPTIVNHERLNQKSLASEGNPARTEKILGLEEHITIAISSLKESRMTSCRYRVALNAKLAETGFISEMLIPLRS